MSTIARFLGLLAFLLTLTPLTASARQHPLDFLDEGKRLRLDEVERIEVLVSPVVDSSAATRLDTLCAAVPDATALRAMTHLLAVSPVIPAAPGPAATLSALDNRIKAIVEESIEIADMCRRLTRGEPLVAADVVRLRAMFLDELEDASKYANFFADPNNMAALVAYDVAVQNSVAGRGDQAKDILARFEPTQTGASQGLSGGLGLTAQVAFEGLAEFLIDRAKEEALTYVRDQLQAQLCEHDPKYFIPQLCETLATMDPTMQLSAIGSSLHTAMFEDLELLPDRLLVLAAMHTPNIAYAGTVVRVALPMILDAKRHENPRDHLASLYAAELVDCELAVISTSTKLDKHGAAQCALTMAYLRLSSAVLRAVARNLPSDPTSVSRSQRLAIAFDFERFFNAIPDGARTLIQGEIGALATVGSAPFQLSDTNLGTFDDLLRVGSEQAIELESVITKLVNRVNLGGAESISADEVAGAAVTAIRGVAAIASESRKLASSTSAGRSLEPALERAAKLAAIAQSITSEDWATATTAALTFVLDELTAAGGSEELNETIEFLRKYLPLFVEVANASSSADVKAALEAAFPAGGYKLKYKQPAIALNGFIGIYGGGVYTFQPDTKVRPEGAMFAPIGLHVTGPLGVRKKRPWYLGGLLSVIDLGAITTSKFLKSEIEGPVEDGTTTSVDEPAEFNIAALLSPGAYLTIGIARSPFTVGLGASYNPFAQRETETTYAAGEVEFEEQRYLGALRFGAFLAVDITMLAFGL